MYQRPFSFNFIRKGACSQFIYSCVCRGVPEDISIMGCDYSATYAELGYNLTSIEISLHDIARAALRSVVGIDAKRKLKCPAILIKGTTA